jgi:hypothetical protein
MGDAADDVMWALERAAFDYDPPEEDPEDIMENRMWLAKDGRWIAISEMTDSHLANAIALIQRSGNWRREQLDRLLLEQQIRSLGLSSGRASS